MKNLKTKVEEEIKQQFLIESWQDQEGEKHERLLVN